MSPRRRPEIGNHHTRILIAAQARLLRVWKGIFAAGDRPLKSDMETIALHRHRKSETATRKKWLQSGLSARELLTRR